MAMVAFFMAALTFLSSGYVSDCAAEAIFLLLRRNPLLEYRNKNSKHGITVPFCKSVKLAPIKNGLRYTRFAKSVFFSSA